MKTHYFYGIRYIVCLFTLFQYIPIHAQILQSGAQTTIIGTTTIIQEGTYVLGRDIEGPIVIAGDDVVLNLNNHIIDGGTNGIFINNVKNITVQDGSIRNSSLEGVFINSCTHVILDNLALSFCTLSGIKVLNSSDVDITHCFFQNNNTSDTSGEAGLKGLNFIQSIVQNNVLSQNNQRGIDIEFGIDTVVRNCIVQTSIGTGIFASFLNNGKIENCTIEENVTGIELVNSDNSIITGCRINNNSMDGINTTTSNNIIIQDNILHTNSNIGITINSNNNLTILNNISNNNINGIAIQSSTDNVCVKNNITNDNSTGILNNASTASFFLNKAQNNVTNFSGVPIGTIAEYTLGTGFIVTPTVFNNISVIP